MAELAPVSLGVRQAACEWGANFNDYVTFEEQRSTMEHPGVPRQWANRRPDPGTIAERDPVATA